MKQDMKLSQSMNVEKESGGVLRFMLVLIGIIVVFVILWYTGAWDVMSTPDRLLAIFAGLILLLLLGTAKKKHA